MMLMTVLAVCAVGAGDAHANINCTPVASIPLAVDASLQADPTKTQGSAISLATEEPSANPPPRTEDVMPEVMVTASRRLERLQDVPISATALTDEELGKRHINQLDDIKGAVPNFVTEPTATPGGAIIAVRGISGQNLPSIVLDTRVGVYLDGVYLARSQGQSFALADIAQVDILRGPQGTLFGRNVTGGAVSFVTPAPTGAFGGELEAGAGDFDRRHIKATLNLPEVNGLSARISYIHDERTGDVKNTAAGARFGPLVNTSASLSIPFESAVSTLGARDDDAAFLAIRYVGVPHLTLDYKFDYSQNRDTPSVPQVIGFPGSQPGCAGASLALGIAINCGGVFNSFGLAPTSASASQVPVSTTRLNSLSLPFEGQSVVLTSGHSLTLQYVLAPNLTFKNIFAYRQLDTHSQSEFDGGSYLANNNAFDAYETIAGVTPSFSPNGVTPFCVECAIIVQRQHQVTEEAQLLGRVKSYLDYIVGGYYFEESASEKNVLAVDIAPQYTYFGAGLAPLTLAPNQAPTSTLINGDDTSIQSRSAAAYAHVTAHLSRQVDLSVGVRDTEDHKNELVGPEIAAEVIDPSTGANVPEHRKIGFSRLTYDATATYKFTPNINVYARYATAYLSGGLFRNIAFKPEDARSEEIGVKGEFFDRRLVADLAAFHQENNNDQEDAFTSAGQVVIENIGTLRTQGLEGSLSVVPVTGLRLDASFGYTGQDYSDGRRNIVPEITAQLALRYDAPRLANGTLLSASVYENYRSKYYTLYFPLTSAGSDTAPLPPAVYQGYSNQTAYLQAIDNAGVDGGYWLADARLSLSDLVIQGRRCRISVFVDNLFNVKKVAFSQNYGPLIGANFEQARRFGVDVSVNF